MGTLVHCGCLPCWQCMFPLEYFVLFANSFPQFTRFLVSNMVMRLSLFLRTTFFQNHSCNPNCRLYPCYINESDIQKPLLVVFSIRDIEPDEEICFNYQGRYPGDEDDDDTQEEEIDVDIPKDKIYQKCECGAPNCRGKDPLMFIGTNS